MNLDEITIIRKPGRKDAPVLRCVGDEKIPVLSYPMLENVGFVTHAFTTRYGGVSEGCFAEMNLCFTRGDQPEAVAKNHEIMAAALGYDASRAVHSHQTHTTNVIRVGEELAGNGVTKPQALQDVDGMVTNVPGMALLTFYADCTPLYFVDPVHKAIGLSHSGWKGTVGRIGAVTLNRMAEEFGTEAKDVLCCIGPCICQDCYEVSEDVADAFRREFSGAESLCILEDGKEPGKYQLDLWRANEQVLLEAGVLREHIETTNICTKCNPKLLFSHRIMGNARGNLTAILMIK